MTELFASPSTYIQGPGELFDSSAYIEKYGKKVLLLSDSTVLKIVGNDFNNYLAKNGFDVNLVTFNGEASETEIDRVTKIGKDSQDQIIIGLGGGKTADSAKAIADNLGIAVMIAPTIASTDAPCSRLSVIYTDDGQFDHYRFYKKNPEIVLLDTKVISGAPVHLLISGMADALATNVEATDVRIANADNMLGAKQTIVAGSIGQACEDTLFEYGELAISANKQHVATPALDKVVEANTLLSGLGFESGGLAAAHAIHNGFTALSGDIHHLTHGEKVAYGTLVELILDGSDKQRFKKFLDFDLKLGLPTTLADLHLGDASDEDLMKVATQACDQNDTMKYMPTAITPDDVFAAIKAVDEYSSDYQGNEFRE
ncbi:glycerol dehydrogenase [Lentilactobacillus fungorum]|jgi:glycerol dehydrogenase|uniref:Glycerol dehydrogenase n=1 Tax=Lentilactobacillus fungorum TaxID=2201250 RepID=A0ABQ3VYX3_9LACO|nr:glycerol dehydrogenase [Lentilactobacillus fungorum]GHP14090.1 glycerol dehydrogenase [Lentilactobacillus fungorum]